jgi:hypothetical protein
VVSKGVSVFRLVRFVPCFQWALFNSALVRYVDLLDSYMSPGGTYQAGIDAFGEQGVAEIIYLVGCFHLIGIILNGYDVSAPGREDGIVLRAA